MPKNIQPTRKRNKITFGCKTVISATLIQSNINKWMLSKLAKLDKLSINSASTILLQRSNIYFIEYKN